MFAIYQQQETVQLSFKFSPSFPAKKSVEIIKAPSYNSSLLNENRFYFVPSVLIQRTMPFINSTTYRQLATFFFFFFYQMVQKNSVYCLCKVPKKKVQMGACYYIIDFEIEVKFDHYDLILNGWLELTIFQILPQSGLLHGNLNILKYMNFNALRKRCSREYSYIMINFCVSSRV